MDVDADVQDAEQRSAEVLEELQALQGQVKSGTQLLEQATAKVSAGEVALEDTRREISRLEQALQEARAEISLDAPNGHVPDGAPKDVALEIDELEVEQLRSENEALKERLAAAGRRSSTSGQGQASPQSPLRPVACGLSPCLFAVSRLLLARW